MTLNNYANYSRKLCLCDVYSCAVVVNVRLVLGVQWLFYFRVCLCHVSSTGSAGQCPVCPVGGAGGTELSAEVQTLL